MKSLALIRILARSYVGTRNSNCFMNRSQKYEDVKLQNFQEKVSNELCQSIATFHSLLNLNIYFKTNFFSKPLHLSFRVSSYKLFFCGLILTVHPYTLQTNFFKLSEGKLIMLSKQKNAYIYDLIVSHVWILGNKVWLKIKNTSHFSLTGEIFVLKIYLW